MSRNTNEILQVKGMFCPNCEKRIEKGLGAIAGVRNVCASYQRETVAITYDADQTGPDRFREVIGELGYELRTQGQETVRMASVLVILLASYVIARHLGWTRIFNVFPSIETGVSLGMLFVIGLLTSVHCVAMCGGINLSQSVMASGSGDRRRILGSNLAYHAGRVISYTAIGALAGGIGGIFSPGGAIRGAIETVAGVLMLLMALNMLGTFHVLRRWNLTLPAGFYRRVRELTGGRSSFVIGLLNGLMPCGPLQSMQIYALSTGSAALGALAMFLFSLGTVPLLLGFGLVSGGLQRKYTRSMLTVSALLIFLMGLNMIGNGLSLTGVSFSLPGRGKAGNIAVMETGVQTVTSRVDYGSYEPITVQKGVPVDWTILVPEGRLNGCNSEIIVPAYGIDLPLQEGENHVSFTPDEAGTVPFSCWMGMIRSSIEVVE